MKTINISLTEEQYEKVNKLTDKLGFANRSEFFRALLRPTLNRQPGDEDKGEQFDKLLARSQRAFREFLVREGYNPAALSEEEAYEVLQKTIDE